MNLTTTATAGLHCWHRPTRHCLSLMAAVSLLAGCINLTHAELKPIDCAVPHIDRRLSECAVVRYASEFSDCLSEQDIDRHSCIVMDSDLSFCDASASLPITAIFDRSERQLDCRGGTIDHGWGRVTLPGGPATTATSRMPAIRFMDDRSLSDISVSNCLIRGTDHIGIQATRFFGGELGPDGVLAVDDPLPQGHSNLLFQDLRIEDTGLGIYLGTFSRDVAIQRVHIDNSRRIAIYSEAGSHGVQIRDSIISNNQTREAVALDSTYDSEVSGNLFLNNREGGINAYLNCGELKGIVCPVIRSTAPNNNRLTNNTFINTGVSGIQIASRQGRRHAEGWCATLDGQAGKFTDTSEGNIVTGNTFVCSEGTAIAIHDGPNEVSGNTVIARDDCIPFEISTGGLGRSASPLLDGLRFTGNRIDSSRPPRLRNLSESVLIED